MFSGMTKETRFVQPENVPTGIVVMTLGRMTEVKLEQCSNT